MQSDVVKDILGTTRLQRTTTTGGKYIYLGVEIKPEWKSQDVIVIVGVPDNPHELKIINQTLSAKKEMKNE